MTPEEHKKYLKFIEEAERYDENPDLLREDLEAD